MKKILISLVVVSLIGSANIVAMQVGDAAKVTNSGLTDQQLMALEGPSKLGMASFNAAKGAAAFSIQDYKVWLRAKKGLTPAAVPAVVSQVGGRKHYHGGQCPKRPGGMKFRGPGRGKFRTPEERVSRMVRRTALSAGNIQDANALIVSMQQAVRDLANDPDIQNLPAIAPAVAPAAAPQAPVARQFKQKFGGRRYGKHQHKLRTPDEMVERIRCIALSKGNGSGANAFITAVEKAIGDLANDQKIKRLPNK